MQLQFIVQFIIRRNEEMKAQNREWHFSPNKLYSSAPQGLQIVKVAAVTRHGDRTPIAKQVGSLHKESEDISSLWRSILPTEETHEKLKSCVAFGGCDQGLYVGSDYNEHPHGMLTERGVQQLYEIGKSFRQRYCGSLLSTQKQQILRHLYPRSTDYCRTILSVRSLMMGLLEESGNDEREGTDRDSLTSVTTIHTRDRRWETLYPQADGRCAALSNRKLSVIQPAFLAGVFPDYYEFEKKVKATFGYLDSEIVDWLNVRDALTVYNVYSVLPDNYSLQDVARAGEIATFIWRQMFEENLLNKLAIGRFLSELLHDLSHQHGVASYGCRTLLRAHEVTKDGVAHTTGSAKLCIYGGHDATIVPLLCALGIFDGVWPPYASCIVIELAEETEPLSSANTSTNSSSNSSNNDSSNNKWIRLMYNDEIMKLPIETDARDSRFPSWVPLDSFMDHLKPHCISREEYAMMQTI